MRDFQQQSVGISSLIAASPLPVAISPYLESLITLIAMVEGSETRIELFNRNKDCPAMDEYKPEWETINKRIIELTKEVNDLAAKHIREIDVLAQNFEFSRTRIVAACQKKDCPDRDGAQERLGWEDGEEIRL